MWYTWTTLLLVSCTLVKADGEAGAEGAVATTRVPPRTLDRQAAELAWKSWLQSPESGNQNAPPRRITTKSLFITPLVCPKGQRLDRNGCIQVVTVNKDEHERILLEQLNALFTTPANGNPLSTDVIYDYGEDEPGPLQLSIPIGLDPQAAPLHGQEPSAQAQELQGNYVNKKDGSKPNTDMSIEAELELLKLQNLLNQSDAVAAASDILNHNIVTNMHTYSDKPKRDNANENITVIGSQINTTDVGQKELVFGHVNVDPVIYSTEIQSGEVDSKENIDLGINSTEILSATLSEENKDQNSSTIVVYDTSTKNITEPISNSSAEILKKGGDPDNDYSDIGEAIKLISRYADVTTDDNFAKEKNKYESKEDSILGTRTKLQYRRNKPKEQKVDATSVHVPIKITYNPPTDDLYYRYPWLNQHTATPPPDYPFHHLQDYWPGRGQVGGIYNTHENPRRHHHSYPHNYRQHGYPHPGFGVPSAYPEQLKAYIHRMVQHHNNRIRPKTNNQDLYSLLGLRHWFSSEETSKR